MDCLTFKCEKALRGARPVFDGWGGRGHRMMPPREDKTSWVFKDRVEQSARDLATLCVGSTLPRATLIVAEVQGRKRLAIASNASLL